MVAHEEYGFKLNGTKMERSSNYYSRPVKRINLENFSIHSSLLSNYTEINPKPSESREFEISERFNFSRSPDLLKNSYFQNKISETVQSSKPHQNNQHSRNNFQPKYFTSQKQDEKISGSHIESTKTYSKYLKPIIRKRCLLMSEV